VGELLHDLRSARRPARRSDASERSTSFAPGPQEALASVAASSSDGHPGHRRADKDELVIDMGPRLLGEPDETARGGPRLIRSRPVRYRAPGVEKIGERISVFSVVDRTEFREPAVVVEMDMEHAGPESGTCARAPGGSPRDPIKAPKPGLSR